MKHDYDKILTRLTAILSRLYQGEKLQPKDLSEEFNVSLRTIQRDFKERLLSFPIFYENKHWQMDSNFKLEKNISIQDSITLDILENLSSNFGNHFHTQTSKILNKLKNRHYSPIFTKLNMEDISDEFKAMITFEEAILSKNPIKIKYTTEKKEEDVKINPIKIVNFEGLWYLVATDENNKLKSYYIKNITLLKTYKLTFTIPKKIEEILNNAISIWFSDNEPFKVILEVDNHVAKFFKTKPISATQEIVSEDENKLTISVMASSDWEIIPIVKSWIPFVKVIEPKRIQLTVQEEAKKFLEL
ncbi:MAG: WYL domain-containing protein [Campylobacterota bacterium]|nr:WYL domain-containing protein [Campylobacterota bacterium]